MHLLSIVCLVTLRSNDPRKADLLVITDHSLHNPQFTSTHRGPDEAGRRSRQSFVHSLSKVSCMQQCGNIDKSVMRRGCRYTVPLVHSDGVDPRGGKVRFQIGAPLCRGAPEFGSSSRSLSLPFTLSRLLVPTLEITREMKARFLTTYWPILDSSREVTRDEDIDSVEVTHPWWGFELVE